MATPEVEQYIKNELARGTSRVQIENNLLDNGWNQDDIERGFAAVKEQGQSYQSAPPQPVAPSGESMQAATPNNAYTGTVDASVNTASFGASTQTGGNNLPPDNDAGHTSTQEGGNLPGPFALLGEAFQYALGRFWHLIGIMLVFGVISAVLYGVFFAVMAISAGATFMSMLPTSGGPIDIQNMIGAGTFTGIFIIGSILFYIVGIFLQMWYQASFLYGVASPEPSFGQALGRGFKLLLPLLATMLALTLTVMGGSVLFLVPGIIFSVWFMFAPFIIVDETEPARGYQALVRSREYMSGRSLGVFGRLLFLTLPYLFFMLLVVMMGSAGEAGAALGIATFALGILMFLFYLLVAPSYTFLIYSHLKRINPNPEKAPKLRGRAIAFSVLGAVAPILIPVLLASSVIFSSLNVARSKGNDAQVQSALNNFRASAELYRTDNGDSYAGLCESEEVGIFTASASEAASEDPTCNASAAAWAVSAPLSDTSTYYCVDGAGFAGETSEPLLEGTVCPTPLE